ncbi:MAG: DNA polymerase III subunit delta [Bacteroidetes bacterium]|nr:DNA polymerase III subunit delta [Bacteroidota bacterium]
MSFQQIKNRIEAGQLKAVYFLSGEETWSIDVLTDLIMEKALTDAERDFNQHIFYGKDSNPQEVLNAARRYPVFAERQLVIVKEAQHFRSFELFETYVQNPAPTTILVFNYKHKSIDQRTAFGKLLKKHTEFMKAMKLKEYAVPEWIKTYVEGKGKSIDPKSSMLIVDHVGNDLAKISNEIDKLLLNIPEKAKKISAQHIEDYIGISKEFNAFELSAALATKDFSKAMRIIHYFGQNPKAGPLIFVLTVMFNYFTKIFQLHLNKGLSDSDAAKLVRVNPYYFKDYKSGMKHYNLARTEKIIEYIAEYDARGKGVGSTNAVTSYELMKELIYKIMM